MKKTKGMSVVEIVVAVAVVSAVGLTFASALSRSLALSYRALRTTQTAWLLEESAEAIKTIRDVNWPTIQNLTTGTNYYLTFDTTTNSWSLTTTDPGPINGIFSRRIVFSDVFRDSNDDIASSGTLDNETKYVTVTTSFLVGEATVNETMDFYISNIF